MKHENEMPLFKFEHNRYPLTPGTRLLEASAGTGKTFALSHIVLRLLTEANYSIKEILVVTFTEATAAELKARISCRIDDAILALDAFEKVEKRKYPDEVLKEWIEIKAQNKSTRESWISLLIEALETIDHADITTIHGFCRRTLQRESLDCDVSLNVVLEEEDSDLVFEVVHDYWRHEVLSICPKHLKGIKDAGFSIENLYRTLIKIDNDPSLSFKIKSSNLNPSKPLVNQFNNCIQIRWENFASIWNEEGKDLDNSLKKQAEEWRHQGFKDTKPFSPKPTKKRYELVNDWIENIYTGKKDFGHIKAPSYEEIRKQTYLGNYYHPSIICETAQRCDEHDQSLLNPKLQKAIAEIWDGPAEQVWEHALSWALNVLKERRQQRGVITYGGLLKALDPGKTPAKQQTLKRSDRQPLLDKLQKRYRVTLIDEFQDTDSLQWRLLKQAFGNSPNNLLLMVGDPKQAIYRFRGGDLNIYMSARAEVDRIDELRDNFRTKPNLMNQINNLMSPGLRRSSLKVPALTPNSIKNAENVLDHQYPLKLLTILPDKADEAPKCSSLHSKGHLEEIIPTAVTNSVLRILKEPAENLNPSDICILVSRHNQAASIRLALSHAGLASRLVCQGDILASEAANVLQRFLDCLAMPDNSARLRLVACSALLQWDVKKLKIAEVNGDLDELAARFKYWSRNLPKLGLMGCLSELLNSQVLANISERGRLLGDLQQCVQLVQEVTHRQRLDAISAARWLKRQRLNPVENIPNNREPRSDVEENAVNVVTVHRSKGLEYRVVICPYLWQAPPSPVGPLWRLKDSDNWLIALNSKWGKGKNSAEEEQNAAYQEAERLSYVAITRAKDQLIIFWAQGANQKGNPLTSLLFGPKSLEDKDEDLTLDRLLEWTKSNKVGIRISSAETEKINGYWHSQEDTSKLCLGPVPQRRLDSTWSRNSYSSLVNSDQNHYIQSTRQLKEKKVEGLERHEIVNGNKTTSEALDQNSETPWSSVSPLSKFPRGSIAGDCLHKVLERINFNNSLKTSETKLVIEEELQRAGLDINLCSIVQEGLSRVLDAPLGGVLGDLTFKQLHENRRIHELSFDIPIAQAGNQIQALDLANTFLKVPQARFGSNYAEQLASLNISCRGFLTGAIDLVFTDQEDTSQARWWVVDWKSNWIGNNKKKEELDICGPHNYNDLAMEKMMIHHHYPLQAHFYLIALHRFLKWRLPNYNPTKHLGGYIYVFLRGIPGTKELKNRPNTKKIPGLIIEEAAIERVKELDRLLKRGGE